MFYGKYTRRDQEEKAILRALGTQDATQIARILEPHRSRWGKTKLALGLTLSPCTTATLEAASDKGNLECVKLIDHGHSAFWRGSALSRVARRGELSLVQWFSQDPTSEIEDRDFAYAVSFSAEHGHMECLLSLKHKWYTVDRPERMMASAAANEHEDMLRFLFKDFSTEHSKEELASLTLLHLGAFHHWAGIAFIAQNFHDLDKSVFKEVFLKFGGDNLHLARTHLEHRQLKEGTRQAVAAPSKPRRI